MKIIERNKGPKIPYEVIRKTKIIFNDDLMLDLAKRQTDEVVLIDICFDSSGAIIMGTTDAKSYVAQIIIPPAEYEEIQTAKKTEASNDMNNGTQRKKLPLDMEQVELILWSI